MIRQVDIELRKSALNLLAPVYQQVLPPPAVTESLYRDSPSLAIKFSLNLIKYLFCPLTPDFWCRIAKNCITCFFISYKCHFCPPPQSCVCLHLGRQQEKYCHRVELQNVNLFSHQRWFEQVSLLAYVLFMYHFHPGSKMT